MRRLNADIVSRTLRVIVAGDLNATGASAVHRLLTHHLTDAHEAVGRGFGWRE